MATYYTKGIILRKTDRGEADQLFSIYTETHGKVLALGRATKKIESKLNNSLQPFTTLQLMLAHGRAYDHVAGVEIVKNFPEVIKDLKKIVLANYSFELVDTLTKLGNGDIRIYKLVEKYLDTINSNAFLETDWQLIKQAFVIKLLSLLGFAPPAEVAGNEKKLDDFLNEHLDFDLKTRIFLSRLGA